jgi:hypothetical protein
MNPKKSLATLALGLTLIGGIADAHAAHAEVTVGPGPVGTVTPSFPQLRPAIEATIGNCSATITGTFFTPGSTVTLRVVDLNRSSVSDAYTTAAANGTFAVQLGVGQLGTNFKVRAKDGADDMWSHTLIRYAPCVK